VNKSTEQDINSIDFKDLEKESNFDSNKDKSNTSNNQKLS